jgi:hypothetical protein
VDTWFLKSRISVCRKEYIPNVPPGEQTYQRINFKDKQYPVSNVIGVCLP